ncbi:hypothetical protein ACVWXN_006027 [Bradyrhizobium sp. i1.4.4]
MPAQEQRRVDMRRTLAVGKPREAAEDALTGAQVVAEAAPHGQIAIELGGEAHCAPPTTGQGIAIDRSPSMSRRAYIMVDVRERCRSTSPTSSSDAPEFVALPFVAADDGIAAGEPIECFNPTAVVMKAEALSRKEGHIGAVAFSRTGDPATGDFGDAKVIRKFGEVPDDLSAL